MPRNLRALIIASGYAGTAGQTFRNHVAGAASGATMRQYIMESPAWANAPSSSTVYPATQNFGSMTLTINTYGSRASNIHNTATGAWSLSYISPLNTASVVLNSVSWASNVCTLNFTLYGEITTGSPTVNASVWYATSAYPSGWPTADPNLPYGSSGNTDPTNCSPDCTTSFLVTFSFTASPVAASGNTTNDLRLAYTPDNYAAGFNPNLYGPGPGGGPSYSVQQDRRPGATVTIDAVEWASDAAFTTIVGTGQTYSISSDNTTTATVYLRYKLNGASSWTEYPSNPINWQDPRDDV